MQTLVQLPTSSTESVRHLSQLLNTVNESVNTFTSLERPVTKWDDILVYFIESKLAVTTRLDWVKEVERRKLDFPKYSDLQTFLEDRIRTLDLVEADSFKNTKHEESKAQSSGFSSQSGGEGRRPQFYKKTKGASVHMASRNQGNPRTQCSFCNGDHFLGYCQKFALCSLEQRNKHATEAKLCRNCLNSSHTVDTCISRGRCLVCNGKHNTKLHQNSATTTCATIHTEDSSPPEPIVGHATTEAEKMHAVSTGSTVLLSTACVILQSSSGQWISVRALLDSGAEESFLTEHVAQVLSLEKTPANVTVSGVGGGTTAVPKSRVAVTLKATQDANFSFTFSALVLKKLTALIPRTQVTRHSWPHLANLQLADPHFDKTARIDCILNCEAYAAALLPVTRKGSTGMPIALRSVFGWVLMGATTANQREETNRVNLHHVMGDAPLSEVVSRFWELEEVPAATRYSLDDEACYDHFRSSHTRNETGRFVVRLPFLHQPPAADTRAIAEACFKRLERRFSTQPDLAQAYGGFMREYIDMHHMEIIPNDQVKLSSIYLPHHPVIKKDGSKKLRVVFNASQKNAAGLSLNSFLHTGPKFQEDVLIILIRWSFFPVVFTCDIIKMFRQFLVHPDDVEYQSIVWRDSPNLSIDAYRLITVTYGTACAPFLANACMLQLADDEREKFPLGAKVLKTSRYVDDRFEETRGKMPFLFVINSLIF